MKDEINKQVEFICELTGFGQALHPNDIKHCFEKVITKSQSELREKIANYTVDLCENSQEFKNYILKLLETK